MIHKMGYDTQCETCGDAMMFDEVNTDGNCGQCEIAAINKRARMRQLYEGEKRAGLLDPDQTRQDIKDAGRGHLLK